MNKIYKYCILCEDIAHRTFIKNFLSHQDDLNFEEVLDFNKRVRANNKTEVENSIPAALKIAFTKYQADILLVVRDTDTHRDKEIEIKRRDLQNKISNTSGVILVLPVQCIEHWLLRLKYANEKNDDYKKELENIPRKDAKRCTYDGKLKPQRELQIKIISTICLQKNYSVLEHHSQSFRTFKKDFDATIDSLSSKKS